MITPGGACPNAYAVQQCRAAVQGFSWGMRPLGPALRAATVLVIAAALSAPVVPATAQPGPGPPRPVSIPARDGVVLTGNLLVPSARAPVPGVVLIAPWGTPDAVYLAQSTLLAQRGYIVLSYTNRGFGGSGGTVSLAGPAEVADVSDVIDWLIANTAVDPERIGVGGVSYGAGISLVAAGHDPRIKAVVAMSGWADLVETFYRGGTRAFGVLGSVRFFVEATGRPSPELTRVLEDFFADRNREEIIAWTRVRSAITYLDGINKNRPAIYIAQAYGDTFFPPNQMVGLFNRLTGPKRLELSPGDHGTPESSGLLGLPNPLWTAAGRWFDQYVAGVPTGIDEENPVVLRGGPIAPVETYPDWDHVRVRSDRYGLGPVPLPHRTGELVRRTVPEGWEYEIESGLPTTADAGFIVLTNWFASLTGIAPIVWLPTVSRPHAGVWLSARLEDGMLLRGAVQLRLETRQQPAGTVIAYLFDVDDLEIGRLIAHQPATWRDGAGTLDLGFPATRWDVPPGHRLALVVDTVDPLYGDQGPRTPPLVFTGPSWLDLPVR
jgi:hypothetical protein